MNADSNIIDRLRYKYIVGSFITWAVGKRKVPLRASDLQANFLLWNRLQTQSTEQPVFVIVLLLQRNTMSKATHERNRLIGGLLYSFSR